MVETWNSLELFFCVEVAAPASSRPQALSTIPAVNRGISNMHVYVQDLTLDFSSLLSSQPAQLPVFHRSRMVYRECFLCVLTL